jgi:hypothetical protein
MISREKVEREVEDKGYPGYCPTSSRRPSDGGVYAQGSALDISQLLDSALGVHRNESHIKSFRLVFGARRYIKFTCRRIGIACRLGSRNRRGDVTRQVHRFHKAKNSQTISRSGVSLSLTQPKLERNHNLTSLPTF